MFQSELKLRKQQKQNCSIIVNHQRLKQFTHFFRRQGSHHIITMYNQTFTRIIINHQSFAPDRHKVFAQPKGKELNICLVWFCVQLLGSNNWWSTTLLRKRASNPEKCLNIEQKARKEQLLCTNKRFQTELPVRTYTAITIPQTYQLYNKESVYGRDQAAAH